MGWTVSHDRLREAHAVLLQVERVKADSARQAQAWRMAMGDQTDSDADDANDHDHDDADDEEYTDSSVFVTGGVVGTRRRSGVQYWLTPSQALEQVQRAATGGHSLLDTAIAALWRVPYSRECVLVHAVHGGHYAAAQAIAEGLQRHFVDAPMPLFTRGLVRKTLMAPCGPQVASWWRWYCKAVPQFRHRHGHLLPEPLGG